MRKILTFFLLQFCLIPLISLETEEQIIVDPLKYPSLEQALSIWTPVMGRDAASLLGVEQNGLRLKDISGDTYEANNTQKAVFLRKPLLEAPYFIEVTVREFNPSERYGQAGLVAWKDQDNYIRATLGFNPAGVECLGEFDGKALSRGVLSLFPGKNPRTMILRMEILERSVRAAFSFDRAVWFAQGGFTLPGNNTAGDYFQGCGILGVGGGASGAPLFTDWTEGSLPPYRDDEFEGAELKPPWRCGIANGGWGRDKTRIQLESGTLLLHPFPGSDIYLGNENYPYISQPAPRANHWEIEIALKDFNPWALGRYNKAGIVLWQDTRHFLCVSLVADDEGDRMYCEALSPGDRKHIFGVVRAGFRRREISDAFIRLKRLAQERYQVRISYDGKEWLQIGEFRNALYEPQLRLFASGDIFIQYPQEYDFSACFDYVRQIPETKDGK